MSLHRRLISLAMLLLAALSASHACAAEKPLWEPGVGIAWILGESSTRVEAFE